MTPDFSSITVCWLAPHSLLGGVTRTFTRMQGASIPFLLHSRTKNEPEQKQNAMHNESSGDWIPASLHEAHRLEVRGCSQTRYN
jgi:hypothetical protein